ncbi:MAG TPA: UDP-N-acetylglucosamine 2-epimerase (non-hydrolyzing) [Planctomycetaceae bacterium]|nr:UDP-N-acetylglucosamine 2-epimerase (non-hydrolyzing) [Planctomycetaceae bacterium]
MPKVLLVVGARPNFMKMAPLYFEMVKAKELNPLIVHTGQHYDYVMSQAFFEDLELPQPHHFLGTGSGSHAEQTARIMVEFEKVVLAERPDLVVVFGDVNSTVACSLTAKKLLVPVAHVEAGLRSFDMTMPEEINRKLTDSICDLLFVTEESGLRHLRAEGVAEEKIHMVGNVMIDTLKFMLPTARQCDTLSQLGVKPGQYAVVTLHRPANVDSAETLGPMLDVLVDVSRRLPVVFPIHPRTQERIKRFGLADKMQAARGVIQTDPLGYLEFLALTSQAKVIVTDSGGLQEESTVLGIPCLTARPNTERPITVDQGTSTLVGNDAEKLRTLLEAVLDGTYKQGTCPELWDGHAAERIARILVGKG